MIDETDDKQNTTFSIEKIYVKDLSFKAPNIPEIFKSAWKPELKLDVDSTYNALEENLYEVIVSVVVTVTSNTKVAFLAEVQQAGVFRFEGFNNNSKDTVLNVYCPNTIYPYAREVISDVVIRGGFPQLVLAPINFDILYKQKGVDQSDQISTVQ